MKIQILISKNSWAMNYKKDLKKKLGKYTKKIIFLNYQKKLKNKQDINIIFSYFKIIDKKSLKKSSLHTSICAWSSASILSMEYLL